MTFKLLMETGDALLLENGDDLLLESTENIGGLQPLHRQLHAGYGAMQQVQHGLHRYRVTMPGGGGGGTTWNSADKSGDLTLSGGDLTATVGASSNYETVRSLTSKNTGKYYFEILYDVDNGGAASPVIGICKGTFNVDNTFLGGTADSIGYFPADGNVYKNFGTIVGSQGTYTAGDVVGCAVDLDAGHVWFSKNGAFASGNPATDSGPHQTFTGGDTFFAACCLVGTPGGDAGTARFASGSWSGSAPSGFGVWS